MRRTIILLTALLTCCLVQLSAEAVKPDPLADPEAVVTSGRARFTVLTPEMIRIQYSSTAKFEDRATFAVVNRRLPVPAYTIREEDGYLFIETEVLTLRYKKNSIISAQYQKPDNLSVTMKMGGHDVIWYPGKVDALNLKGTKRTLDTASGDNQRTELENGIISRAGWAVIDESPSTRRADGSTTFAFDGEVDGIAWLSEPVDPYAVDLYFMGYGHQYKKAIGDYISIAGRQPMPPLYALGYWYSKYQRYTQSDFMNLTNEMRQNDIPIDVMIMDMDWHLDGWTGWTWNRNLISNPEGLIRWMHQQGLKVSLNLHPADGVASHEEHFSEIRSDMGLPAGVDRVPWQLHDSTFYRSLFSRIIRDRERQGVDFWWLDWQQNLTSRYVDGLGETFWCNHVFYNDMRLNRTDRRPLIFHRWGGLGSHRYPIGFSGDTYGTFGSLAFQPYFTATASNVCFGYWGHDLGGHLQLGDPNPELMLRWLQFGVFSPIFRTHGASQAGNERRIWKYENFPSMLKCVHLRYQLMPYIYTAARQAYDTGISICRPLYYEWPEENEAYRSEQEYMFGDDILVSPVVTASERDGKAFHRTWLPQGQWYDVCRGMLVEGGQTIGQWYGQEEIPYFYRAGAVIPCNPKLPNLKTRPDELHLIVVPGADGETSLYEDQGDTQDYMLGAYTTTVIRQQCIGGQILLDIMPRSGYFEGMPTERSYTVQVLDEDCPQSVSVNDVDTDSWSYDDERHEVTVRIAATSCDQPVTVRLQRAGTGIGVAHATALCSEQYFDLQGRQLSSALPNTPCIIRRTWSDGRVQTIKEIRK